MQLRLPQSINILILSSHKIWCWKRDIPVVAGVSVSYMFRECLTESSKSPGAIAKSNKQWVGTCLYQEDCKLLLINCEYPIDRQLKSGFMRWGEIDSGHLSDYYYT